MFNTLPPYAHLGASIPPCKRPRRRSAAQSTYNLLESLLEISIVSPVCLNREHFVTKADQHLLERIQSPDNQIGGQMVAA
jgi:hypothetical protein